MTKSYKNLAVYLIQGDDQTAQIYVTLEEAMEKNLIVIHETGNVGELSADNKSECFVFILSGDIVKGGRQDRTIAEDIILEPNTKNIPLKSFCVEQSRWSRRGKESAVEFSSSKKMLSDKKLKIAARAEREQHNVWEEVANFQMCASEALAADVRSGMSKTSLQLTLENEKLQSAVREYVENLEPFFLENKNVLGFTFCVNGKISTADFFGNADLFEKLRSKLLESAANEAALQYQEKLEFAIPPQKEIDTFIADAENGEKTENKTGKNTLEKCYKTDKSVMFQTYHLEKCVHTSIYSNDDSGNENSKFKYGGFHRREREEW